MKTYMYIEEELYPQHLHEELRAICSYSNLTFGWRIHRAEFDGDVVGKHYIGIEENDLTDEQVKYLKELGFKDYTNEWANQYLFGAEMI